MVDKNYQYDARDLRGLLETYLIRNSLWNESNKQPIFLLKDIKEDSEHDATILTFINGQRFKLSVEQLQNLTNVE